MLELTGLGSVLRGIGLLYWLLAFGAIGFAIWKGETWKSKALWAGIWIVLFGLWPTKVAIEHAQRQAYAREAWAYFKKKCATEAGEKIYKTFTGVKSVLVIKPLPPATEKDLYDQHWYGDPYSDANTYKRAESAARHLVMTWRHSSGTGIQRGLEFVEIKDETGDGYIRIHRPLSNDKGTAREFIKQPASKFGVAWEDLSTPEDRKYWVAASRFRVVDLKDNSVIADRIGYLIEAGFGSTAGQRRPWQTARGIGPNGMSCPNAHEATDQWFITKVFKQVESN
jgi:hypothetical protein